MIDDDETCPDTGLPIEDCPCMMCSPPRFHFKYMIADYGCRTISCVIRALKDRLEFFKSLRDYGFRLLGPVEDRLTEFEPPDSEDTYWVSCRSSDCFLEFPIGVLSPETCPKCGKNLYDYEE